VNSIFVALSMLFGSYDVLYTFSSNISYFTAHTTSLCKVRLNQLPIQKSTFLHKSRLELNELVDLKMVLDFLLQYQPENNLKIS
jgi:hypothetical protein